MVLKANPKSTGIVIKDRYKGDYNGTATITGVSIVKSQKAKANNSIAVHMTGYVVSENRELRPVYIIDWYGQKNPDTALDKFAQQMLNRATSAQLSAGQDYFKEDIEPGKVRQKVYDIFKSLIGKKVTISQYTPKGYSLPNINYKFGAEKDVVLESADNVPEIDLDEQEEELVA